MNFIRPLRFIVAVGVCLSMASCSFFASSGRQIVQIETNSTDWMIKVDGRVVSESGSASVELDRTQAHSVVATNGDKKVSAVIDSGISPAGCFDIIGGCIWLIPFVGLASDGAWKLYPDIITLDVSRYDNSK